MTAFNPYVTQAAGAIFDVATQPRVPNQYGVQQAQDARYANTQWVNNAARDQYAWEEAQRRNTDAYGRRNNRSDLLFGSQNNNAIANANAAREAALNAQSTLNSLYGAAAKNLMDAANTSQANSMNALNATNNMFK